MQSPFVATGYCRGCQAVRRWAFAGYATQDAAENSARPRGVYRQCRTCSLTVLQLEKVEDAEGLCRSVIDAWLRAQPGTERMPAIGDPPSYGDKVDLLDALAQLQAAVWHLYLRYRPRPGITFLGYAVGILPRRLSSFIREATGDSTARRADPKPHSVSVGLDAVADHEATGDRPFESGYIAALRRDAVHAGGDWTRDGERLAAEGNRRSTRRDRAAGQPAHDARPERDQASAA